MSPEQRKLLRDALMRALLTLAPLGVSFDTLKGTAKAAGHPQGLERALAVSGAHVHIYGKALSGPGRKMGHVTALGATVGEALATAAVAAAEIEFRGPR